MSIKTIFSISDLENLSGVKAHTIRIWEKRYNLFQPKRTETNIRYYELDNLQKILNVSLLLDYGFKISKIASMLEDELLIHVQSLQIKNDDQLSFINEFKVSMLNFDQSHFENIYTKLLATCSFQEAFFNVFIKLLDDIGILWSSKTITPAHEHFISTLIKQKLLLEIEKTAKQHKNAQLVYVLFLPMNEMHELGLLFVHYMILSKGQKSIYLGSSVPIDSLFNLQEVFSKITFVSYFTVEPSNIDTESYLKQLKEQILDTRGEQLLVTGRNAPIKINDSVENNVVIFKNIQGLIEYLN